MFTKMQRSLAPQYPELHPQLIREFRGEDFGGRAGPAVLPPPPELPEMPLENEIESGSLIGRLQKLKPRTPEEKKLIRMMVADLTAIEIAANELVADITNERNEELEEALEKVRSEGRSQQKIIDALELDLRQKEIAFHSARHDAEWFLTVLNDLRWTKVSRWASKGEREALKRAITKAEVTVRAANEEVAKAGNEHNQAAEAVSEAHQVMAKIANREISLRGQLSGGVFYDPETALPHPPAA